MLMVEVITPVPFLTSQNVCCDKGQHWWVCVIPVDRRIVVGNVKLLSSVVDGSVEGSMQYLS